MTTKRTLINLSVLFDKPTGISNYILNILPYLRPLDPTLLTARPIPDFKDYPIPDDLSPDRGARGHFKRLIWTNRQLGEIYRRLNADLLFSPVPEAPLGGDSRFIVMVHDLIPLRFPSPTAPLTYYFRYYVPRVLEKSRHILCNSVSTARDIEGFYRIPADKITPIPLAYDKNHFRPVGDGKIDRPYFIYLGRPNFYKNVPRILEAFAGLKGLDAHLLYIVGAFDRRYTPKLQRLASELEIGERVRFIDYVSYGELPRILSSATALVFPSLWEGFGLPVLEAMACGTPVITSNLSSLPEVTANSAILVNPYNVGEIRSAMEEVGSKEEVRSYFSKLGLERVKEFSWEKTGNATREVLERYL